MGLLNKSGKKLKHINATDLKAMGFVLQGWGSPTERKMYDTRNYELVLPDVQEDDKLYIATYFEVIWFPKTFMGIPYINGKPVDARGCLWVAPSWRSKGVKLIPLKTMSSLVDILDEIQSWVDVYSFDQMYNEWTKLPSIVRPFKDRKLRNHGTSK
jgi:hypothetical protein